MKTPGTSYRGPNCPANGHRDASWRRPTHDGHRDLSQGGRAFLFYDIIKELLLKLNEKLSESKWNKKEKIEKLSLPCLRGISCEKYNLFYLFLEQDKHESLIFQLRVAFEAFSKRVADCEVAVRGGKSQNIVGFFFFKFSIFLIFRKMSSLWIDTRTTKWRRKSPMECGRRTGGYSNRWLNCWSPSETTSRIYGDALR